ncbi:MobF family relaxase [Williamsia herbipolensis]|uniref:MobF family relaxase n=1 Tax=Williamsia herbipolensis TaxID=1603258 RepID=UPI0006980DA5|nr:MobF family relaxase [Williamsia herbipolensis]
MSLHKLTAGDGYTYLTKQVAAMDATDKGQVSLADYYSAKGESPGVWMGSGLAGLAEPAISPAGARPGYQPPARPDADARVVAYGSQVTEAQMKALFGEGRHPNADAIERAFVEASGSAAAALNASKLGREFAIHDNTAPEFVQRLAVRFREHNRAEGNKWNTPIPAEVRAELRSVLATEMFTERYGRAPADDREATSFITTETRRKASSVAGYDLTFSPVKSVSAVWAIVPREMAQAIEKAHADAVADAVAFIEKEATFSRLGTGGVAQVDSDGLIAAAFTHRDSRAGDPDLHTHVTVSNKVRVTDAAGIKRWMALDGRPLHKAAVSASEVYNSRLEAHCRERLGFAFDDVAVADRNKRTVREVVGVPTTLIEAWSSRRAAITDRTAELSQEFQAAHGREPTTTEAFDLAQRATLETRAAKHEPRSLAEQRSEWRSQAEHVLGGAPGVAAMLAETTGVAAGTPRPVLSDHLDQEAIARYANDVTATVSATRARWSRPHLRAEAERVLRGNETLTADAISPAVEAIVATACGPDTAIACASSRLDGDLNEPAVLRRADGASIYTTHDTDLFTTEAIVSAERRIIAAARRTDGRTIDPHTVEIALLEQAANDRELNAGQSAMVRELATSGRRVQVALAPAGTGKTTAMRTLASAWTDSGGTVLGLAPTAAAAAILRDELGTQTDTVAKLVSLVTDDRDRVANGRPQNPEPDWYRSIDHTTLLVIDEAGMSGTADLDTVVGHVLAAGGSVRLVGDDQQLASISAGGVLRDVAHETGALTLSDVVRFRDPAEGAASLALRSGDPAGLGFYADAHRIHIGADAVAADQAYTAWSTDRAEGRDAVMLAPTRDTVNALNERARADRLAATPTAHRERSVRLADGLTGSAGDIICTRRNKRDLRLSATDWVRNGDRWEITSVSAGGALTARHLDLGRTIALPADYVTDNVTLGYASTIHAAQGMTADTCHVVGSDSLSKQLLYVAMTRGRAANHIYLSTAETDPHKVTTPKARTPDTGLEILTAVLARDESQTSATSTARDALDPFTRLAGATAAYADAVGAACEQRVGADELTRIDTAANTLHPQLTDAPAWPVLRKHLATLAVDGTDPVEALTAAYTAREIGTAADVAAVLDWRLDAVTRPHPSRPPLAWLPTIPAALATDQTWDRYLSARAARITELSAAITDTVGQWDATTAPRWARPFLSGDTDRTLLAEIAVFRAATGVDDTDRRPTGPDHYAAATRRTQQRLNIAAAAHIDTHTDLARWNTLADSIDPHLRRDPFWPDLAEHLDTAARTGNDPTTAFREAAETAPLPTEMPASALWWRVSATLGTDPTGPHELRPDWVADLEAIVGDQSAATITTSAAWPDLVSAITTATAATPWTPHELLATADELLHAGGASDPAHTVRPGDYAHLLAIRVDLLTAAATAPAIPLPVQTPLTAEEEERALVAYPDTHQAQGIDVIDELDALGLADDAYLDAVVAEDPSDTVGDTGSDTDVDHYDDLGFTDFTIAAPLPGPQVATDVATLIADRYEIAAQHADAAAAASAAWEQQAETGGFGGRHEKATIPMVLALRERQDTQRDTRVAVETAHAEWVDADLAAEQLTTPAPTVDDDAGDELAELRRAADADLTAMRIAAATAWLDDCRARLDAAVTAHTEVCTATGGPVTDDDINLITHTARSIDIDELTELRDTRDQLANQLWRIDNALARRHATTDRHLTDIPVADTTAEPAAVELQITTAAPADPLRALTDSELSAEITTARTRLARVESDMALYRRRGATSRVADVRADHDQLHRTAAAIAEATAAARDHDTARDDHDALRRQLVAAQNTLAAARRRERPAAHTRVNDLTREVQTSAQRLATVRAHAEVTAAATGLPENAWAAATSRAADTTALAAEVATARHTEDTARSRDERLAAERAQLIERAEFARAERTRRRNISIRQVNPGRTPRQPLTKASATYVVGPIYDIDNATGPEP